MNLYKHQKEIINADPHKCGLFLGTGTGKTITALSLAEGKTLIIAPKQQVEDRTWERENEAHQLGVDLDVVSKDKFRKDYADYTTRYDTIIGEEAHTLLGVQQNVRQKNKKPYIASSQVFRSLYTFIKQQNPKRIYLVTATPTRNPLCVFAAGALLGSWRFSLENFYRFRNIYYIKLPMPGREAWKPKSDKETKDRLGTVVRSLGYTARLKDLFDVPEETERVDEVPLTAEQKQYINDLPLSYPDPLVLLGKTHKAEQGIGDEITLKENKTDRIIEYAYEFDKLAVFARYKDQIKNIYEKVSAEGLYAITLTGDTKDRALAIENANGAPQCVFICQSQISSGFELPEYEAAIFASLDYSFVNYTQAKGRIQRANNLGAKMYITLLAGEIDHAVANAIADKEDFSERIYANKYLV